MDLPPLVKTALARAWLTAVALEMGMAAQPRDSVPEALWDSPLATPGLVSAGQQALASFPLELQIVLVHEAAVLCGLEPGMFTAALTGQPPSTPETDDL